MDYLYMELSSCNRLLRGMRTPVGWAAGVGDIEPARLVGSLSQLVSARELLLPP